MTPAAIRQQLTGSGQLKPNATEAEFQEAVKKALQGKTLDEFKQMQEEEVRKALADPQRREAMRSGVLQQFLLRCRVLIQGTGINQSDGILHLPKLGHRV